MTDLLPILLEHVEHAGPGRRKELAMSIPRNQYMTHKGKPSQIRELLLTEAVESASLVIAEVYKTVIEGAAPAICMRQAMNIINMKSNTMRVVYTEDGSYMTEQTEGADLEVDVENPTPVTFTAKKYARASPISEELISDSLFDVINMHVKRLGANAENTLNRWALGTLLENSGQVFDTTGSNLGIKAVTATRGKIRGGAGTGYKPTTIVMNPEAETQVLYDYLPTAAYWRDGGTYETGEIGRIMGMDAFVCDATVDPTAHSTYTWGYGADEIGMLVFDKDRAGAIGMRQDITVTDYKNPIKDLTGLTLKMRFDVQKIHANATARTQG